VIITGRKIYAYEMTKSPPGTKNPAENPFEKYLGAAPAFSSRREINAWICELRDEESNEPIPPQQTQAQD
jgi:hypothetical protein